MIAFLVTIVKLLIILVIVATIHELGHFLAAKFFKIGVEEFAVGFGPKIIQRKYKNTMYSLRWLPLGGYCAIEGESGAESDSKTSFVNRSVIEKILVLSMGVIFNVILAVGILVIVGMNYPTNLTTIEKFSDNSILEKAGIQVGDTITAINGKKVKFKAEMMDIRNLDKDYVEVEYIRDGKTETVIIDNAVSEIGYIGASFVVVKNTSNDLDTGTKIDMIASGSAAKQADLKSNDEVIAINSIEVQTPEEIISLVRQNPNKTMVFKIKRGNEILEKEVIPTTKRYFDVGVEETKQVATTIPLAFELAIKNVTNVVSSYADLFKGKVGIDEMSGIVGIGEVVSKTNGLLEFLNLMGIISLAIGVANIMPFPPLDGGKIVIVLGEAITRKKISEKTEAIISYIGFGLLILLTLVVTYNDIIRII